VASTEVVEVAEVAGAPAPDQQWTEVPIVDVDGGVSTPRWWMRIWLKVKVGRRR
jgi:hypothetical protein